MDTTSTDEIGAVEDSDRGDPVILGSLARVGTDATWFGGDSAAHLLLLSAAIGVAWFPTETRPLTAVVIAATGLALCTWGWQRSSRFTVQSLGASGVVLLAMSCSAVSGWDPARAVGEIALAVAVMAFIWLASRSRPPRAITALLAVGLSGLAVWGIWQAIAGLDALRPGLEALPDAARAYTQERLISRRAYASLPLPSHLAVVLATALPLLLARVRTTPTGAVAAIGAVVAAAGLMATRSPVGVALAFLACAALIIGKYRRLTFVVAGLSAAALIAVVAVRPDVARLEPVALRADNWRTAVWLESTSPASGVGVASFAQATQAMPLDVGNRPAHAHNLPLEVLAELGPAGVVGCLALAFWLGRLIVRLWPRDRALAVALAVVPLHNLVDFSFFVSGVALPWALLVGWGVALSRADHEMSGPVRGRILAVIAASAAVALTTMHATSVIVEEAAATRPHAAERFDGALRSLRLAPWRVEPQFLLAAAALETADMLHCDRALAEMNAHRWARPRSAALAERRGRLALVRGDVSTAISELWSAVEFGFPNPERDQALRELLTHLAAGAHDPPA